MGSPNRGGVGYSWRFLAIISLCLRNGVRYYGTPIRTRISYWPLPCVYSTVGMKQCVVQVCQRQRRLNKSGLKCSYVRQSVRMGVDVRPQKVSLISMKFCMWVEDDEWCTKMKCQLWRVDRQSRTGLIYLFRVCRIHWNVLTACVCCLNKISDEL